MKIDADTFMCGWIWGLLAGLPFGAGLLLMVIYYFS